MSQNSDNFQRKTRSKNQRNFQQNSRGGERQNQAQSPPRNPNQKGPGDPVFAKPLEVKVFDGNVERAIKAFRMLVQKERILSDFKEKQTYEKPSVRKRRKQSEYIRNLKEEERKGKKS